VDGSNLQPIDPSVVLKWDQRDAKALSSIVLCLKCVQIISAKTSNDAWEEICTEEHNHYRGSSSS
jgi:hypothetical protein